MNFVELTVLCVIAIDRFIAFCYSASAPGFFTWLFFTAYEALLALGFLKIGFLTKLYEKEFPFAIHRLPRSIGMIVLFFVYLPMWWDVWYDIIMDVFVLLLIVCGIYELVMAILEIVGKSNTTRTDNALVGESSQHQTQPQPQETLPTQPTQNKEAVE